MPKPNVAIQANNVRVNAPRNKPNSNNKNSNKTNKRPRNGGEQSNNNVEQPATKPDAPTQAHSFITSYVNPNGRIGRYDGCAKCPDGTFDGSAGAIVRNPVTIIGPWQINSQIDLTGKVASYLILTTGMLRNMSIVIARESGGEFTNEIMNAFCKTWAQLPDRESITYPSWLTLDLPTADTYVTLIDTQALRALIPPQANGVSGDILSFRFTSAGIRVLFNTPDLVNQGIYTASRFPILPAVKTAVLENNSVGTTTEWLRSKYSVQASLITALFVNATNPIAGLPTYTGARQSLPSPSVAATAGFRNASGTFVIAATQLVRYEYSLTPTPGVDLVNLATAARLRILDIVGSNSGDEGVNEISIIRTSSTGPIETTVVDLEFNILSLPPVTQAGMMQQDPETNLQLLKDTGGVYLPSQAFKPVLEPTPSSDYRKTLFATSTLQLTNLLDPEAGWFDSVDKNFGIGVINLQGVPWACQPVLENFRTMELVGAETSIIGLFVFDPPPVVECAYSLAKSLVAPQKHGYDVTMATSGSLPDLVTRAIQLAPKILQKGFNAVSILTQLLSELGLQTTDGVLTDVNDRKHLRRTTRRR